MFEELKELIYEYVNVEPSAICEESRFIEDLRFNSCDFMSMVGGVGDRFDVEMEKREVVNVKTVKDVAEYIRSFQD